MPIRTDRYTDEELPKDHEQALRFATDLLVDDFFVDIRLLLDDQADAPFAGMSMADYLPPKYLSRYTPQFAKRFLTCLLTVAWKLWAPGIHHLACVGEELALAAIIDRARYVLEDEGIEPDFSGLAECAFEDKDFEWLFEPELDGIEDTSMGRMLAIANLHFDEWFKPFRETNPVHPYVAGSLPTASPDAET